MNPVKEYVINLDKKPELRWRKVINDHKKHFPTVEREIDLILKSVGALGGIAKFTTGLINKIGYVMHKQELEGISALSGIPMSKLILMQICYEMFAACTSIVIKGEKKSNGIDNRYYHFRTMDWEMDFLKDITVNVIFTRGGKPVFRGTTWAGYVGIVTGLNTNYSLALNYRRSEGTLLGNVFRTIKMKWPIGYLVRHVLENNFSDFKAYEALCTYKLISPCYITYCSTGIVSRVIVRECDSFAGERVLTNRNKVPFLIQTNHDVGSKSPTNIMWSHERYNKAKKLLEQKDFSKSKDIKKDILETFCVKPIINEHTIYASLMIPDSMYLKSYVVD